jgi:hypothetical protein
MFTLRCFAPALVVLSLAGFTTAASAGETGTKTMPDSSVNPSHARAVYNFAGRHRHFCNLPSGHCSNNHRVTN